jgi:leader peptidase (prepilin peptidase)/N-methyltransferase
VVGDTHAGVIALAAVVGLIFGSFASVVAYRVPRRESIGGRSRCPACDHKITAAENIPIVSYVVQRGRCRHCGAKISLRYPIVEGATAILFALAVWKFGASLTAVVYAAFFWVLIVLSVIDLDHRKLLNRIVYPAFVIGWACLIAASALGDDGDRLKDAALGAAIFGGFIFAIAFIYPAGMGGGDVKLAFVLGTFLGYLDAPGVVVVGMFLSFLVGSVVGVVTMLKEGGGRKTQVPFGPSLALGSVIAIFVGRPLVDAYLRF